METKDILMLIIGAYGAILSTFLLVKGLLSNRPSLTFIHEFGSNEDGFYIEIIATNSSDKPIDLVSLSYFLGASKAEREVLSGHTVSLEPQKSHKFRVSLNKEVELTLLIEEFLFKTSQGKELPYKLNRSIFEDLRMYIFLRDTPEIFLALEKLNKLHTEIEVQSEKGLKEADNLIKQFESIGESN
ncbi:hypothetical protein [Neptunomonas japonica]|uniref:hypothetical protein n=1 Tax=Neptunomonas japonica TaxID=417574 RepID=UPI0004253C8B|nr:hypothetical protein [Neptunomonas japonica]